MHSQCAMDKQFGVPLPKRRQSKVDPALKQLRRLRFKVVIDAVIQNLDPMQCCEFGVIELNLHVDNMGYPGCGNRGHIFRVLDSAADGNSIHNPRHVHASPDATGPESQPVRTKDAE